MRLGLGLLTTSERHTVTSMLSASGSASKDWTGFYRVFSRDEWDPLALLNVSFSAVLARLPMEAAVIAALDDTKLRKSGKKIPGVSYQRDPMSPSWHPNFIRAQRFAQMSVSARFDFSQPSAARSIPVDFRHAPAAPKPKHNASAEEWTEYRRLQKTSNLSHTGVGMIQSLRDRVDQLDSAERRVIVSVDGSYTNETVLKNLPARVTLIGRIRKDASLTHLPQERTGRGRPRIYGAPAPTPDQLREDPQIPWQSVEIYATGRVHQCDFKQLGPVLWRKAGVDKLLRLIVIRPIPYRLSAKSKLLYRQPAYLISTDLDTPVQELIQAYFSRWDIEVNHRDEKQLIGVGEAQVRSAKSVDRLPAFAVAMYSLLLVAYGQCHGFDATEPSVPIPKWRAGSSSPRMRVPTAEMLTEFRNPNHFNVADRQLNLSNFAVNVAHHMKCPKSSLTLHQAIDYATN